MCPKTVIERIFENLTSEINLMSEADLLKIANGTHELSIKITKKRSTPKIAKEVPKSQKEEMLKRLQECQSREAGLAILSETFKSRKELEQFARFLEVMVLKQDKADRIKSKIIEATIGAFLRSNAIQGKEQNRGEDSTTELS